VWIPARPEGLFRIDASTNSPAGVVGVTGGFDGAALDGGDGAVWLVGNDNILRRIDAATTDVTAQATIDEVGLMSGGVDLAYGGDTVWVAVAAPEGRHVIAFDPDTLERRIHLLVPPIGPLVDPYDLGAAGDQVVLTERGGGVTVVGGGGGPVLSQHAFPTASIGMDGPLAWVPSPTEGLATSIAMPSGEAITTVEVPTGIEQMLPVGMGTMWATRPGEGEMVRLAFRVRDDPAGPRG
jgi:hypothetical protein